MSNLNSILFLLLFTLCFCFFSCKEAKKNPISCNTIKDLGENFQGFENLELARECAEKTKKPLLVVFTCWACVGDIDAIWRILRQKKVKKIINEAFILVALFTDDDACFLRTPTTIHMYSKKCIQTIGQKHTAFLHQHFGKKNHPPVYALFDHQLRPLNDAIGYTPKDQQEKFVRFLKSVL